MRKVSKNWRTEHVEARFSKADLRELIEKATGETIDESEPIYLCSYSPGTTGMEHVRIVTENEEVGLEVRRVTGGDA